MGVGALLNGHIVWLILRGGEVQGLHPQGLAADGLGWVYVDSCFFFFFSFFYRCLHDFLFQALVD